MKRNKAADDGMDDIEAEKDAPNQESFAAGSTGPIPGIKRKWVKGIAIFITAVFLIAFMYNLDNTRESMKPTGPDINEDTRVADADRQSRRNTGGAADSYESLIAKDKERAEAAKRQQEAQSQQAQKNQQAAQAQTVQAQPAPQQRALPAVPQQSYSVPYSLPSQQATPAPQPAPSQQAAPAAPAAPPKDSRNESSIAFGFGGNSMSGAGGTGTDSAGASSSGGGGESAGGIQASKGSLGQPMGATGATYTPLQPNTIAAGTIIPAMLITGINTDSPGQILAQVQSDVYDYDHYNILIPSGSKLIGKLDNTDAATGRVGITFTAVMMPDGGTWNIGNSLIAVDGAGYTGLKGKLNKHTGSMWRNSFLTAGIAALGSMAAGNTRANTDSYTAGQLAAQGALANMINATSNMIGKDTQQATVSVAPGSQFNVYAVNSITF